MSCYVLIIIFKSAQYAFSVGLPSKINIQKHTIFIRRLLTALADNRRMHLSVHSIKDVLKYVHALACPAT